VQEEGEEEEEHSRKQALRQPQISSVSNFIFFAEAPTHTVVSPLPQRIML